MPLRLGASLSIHIPDLEQSVLGPNDNIFVPHRILGHACDLRPWYLRQLVFNYGLSGLLSGLHGCFVHKELPLLINYDVAHLENVSADRLQALDWSI